MFTLAWASLGYFVIVTAPSSLTGVTGNPLGLAGEWRWMVVAEEGAVGVERGL